MKDTSGIILNLKDEYCRFIITDINLGDRGWREEGSQRNCARFEGTSRLLDETRLNNLSRNLHVNRCDKKTTGRRPRATATKFTQIRNKKTQKSGRKKYKKHTKLIGPYKKESREYWEDMREKAKQFIYREDRDNIERRTGVKRKRKHKISKNPKSQEENTEGQTATESKTSNTGTSQNSAKITWARLMSVMQRGADQTHDVTKSTPARAHLRGNSLGSPGKRVGITCKSGFFSSLKPARANGFKAS